jgi:hypothetical protein
LENNEELSKSHSLGPDWKKENATRGIKGVIEFHPGAEAYLKEKRTALTWPILLPP